MKIPPSPHFRAIPLQEVFNVDRQHLTGSLKPFIDAEIAFGRQSFQGIPFELGEPEQPNVLLLDQDNIRIETTPFQATYIIFLHAVEDRPTNYLDGLADFFEDGNELGQHVSSYTLEYADGSAITRPIYRRFAIQQSRVTWGASPFAAVPAFKHRIVSSHSENQVAGRRSEQTYGYGETRIKSGRDLAPDQSLLHTLPASQPRYSGLVPMSPSRAQPWLYALPNPHPEKTISCITCVPRQERSLIYAISYTQLEEHPLRPAVRRKLRLSLPEGATLNVLGELEGAEIDLGSVISARAALAYDRASWLSAEPDAQPRQSEKRVIVEYAAHPQARLYVPVGSDSYVSYDLSQMDEAALTPVNAAYRPVKLRVIDKHSRQPVGVRLHMHGEAGEYLPPRGYHRRVNPFWFEDNYAEFVNGLNQYCYIPGECVADLPLGEVFVEISRGYEVAPIRRTFTVTTETDEITFELERVLDWRDRGWVTADTHVHFLSPQTALLEGAAEGINVVNLLASQWGEMFSNVGDFDGKTTFGAREFGGDGEFLVRVGTENRMQVLGHISLLGYSGSMIHPLCTGGPDESALGDPLEVVMAEWAQRCIDQGGLVVMPHAPNPQCERAADIVLGVIQAMEMMTFNPFDSQLNPYGLADWYRYLNLGYHIPLVGGSDKMSANALLGGIRTYTHLGQRPFTYENWMEAVRAGNTFVTVGPLVEITVEGMSPGSCLKLPAGGGTVNVSWRVESVRLPIEQVEIVMGGLTADQVAADGRLSASGAVELQVQESTWIGLRVRGSYRGQHGEIAAHSSAIQVLVTDQPLFSARDAGTVLDQIEGAIAYVDTIAPRPEAQRYKQLRATLEAAHRRLHQRMHRHGIYHNHNPLHHHDAGPHEH